MGQLFTLTLASVMMLTSGLSTPLERHFALIW